MLKLNGKVSKTGTSNCVLLVKQVMEMYGFKEKDDLILELRDEGVLIRKKEEREE